MWVNIRHLYGHFWNISGILVSFCEIFCSSKDILSLKMLAKFEEECTTTSIMIKKYAAYGFILFCLDFRIELKKNTAKADQTTWKRLKYTIFRLANTNPHQVYLEKPLIYWTLLNLFGCSSTHNIVMEVGVDKWIIYLLEGVSR